jgi:glycosyltransferase involved in cell wall biosynthesis
MKVSVYIPCYNEEKYIEGCLSSLVHQTRFPDEVVVCDNNSTDNTLAIVKKYKKLLPLKIISQPVKGIRPTTEAAWRATTGDILVRTDADATAPPEWLANIVTHFNDDPSLSACGGDSDSLDGTRLMNTIVRIGYGFSDFWFIPVYGYTMLFGPNMAIRRSVMEKINGYKSDDPIIIDDQMISQKLHHHGYKYRRFADCRNLHSTRRYNTNPLELLSVFKVFFYPKTYREKSS